MLLYANKKIFEMYEKFVFDLVKNLEGIKKKIKLKRISLKEDVPLN